MKICSNCASRIKTKEPEKYHFKICKCDYCGEKSYCAREDDWGILTAEKERDSGGEYLMNLFNIK
jgi:hypothetical protein